MSASLHGLFFLPSCCVLTTPIAGCQARLRHLSLHSPFRHGSPLNGGASEGRKKGRRNAALAPQCPPPKRGGPKQKGYCTVGPLNQGGALGRIKEEVMHPAFASPLSIAPKAMYSWTGGGAQEWWLLCTVGPPNHGGESAPLGI